MAASATISGATHTTAENACCVLGGSLSLVSRPFDLSDSVLHAALMVISTAVLKLDAQAATAAYGIRKCMDE